MKTIYLITSGEYSDKQTHAAADSPEEARAIVAKIDPQDRVGYRVEELPLVTAQDVKTLVLYEVVVNIAPDGTPGEPFEIQHTRWVIEGHETGSYDEYEMAEAKPIVEAYTCPPPRYSMQPEGEGSKVVVSGYDREAVLKAVGERTGKAAAETIDFHKAREAQQARVQKDVEHIAQYLSIRREEGRG